MTNPVDLQPFNLLIGLTPAQWRQMYRTLYAHWEVLGDENHSERDQLYAVLYQIQRKCQSNGISLQGGDNA